MGLGSRRGWRRDRVRRQEEGRRDEHRRSRDQEAAEPEAGRDDVVAGGRGTGEGARHAVVAVAVVADPPFKAAHLGPIGIAEAISIGVDPGCCRVVDQAIAVIIEAVAHLQGPREPLDIAVVAVPSSSDLAQLRAAGQPSRAAAKPVAIAIDEPRALPSGAGLVDLVVAVLVAPSAHLHSPRVHMRCAVVAVPSRERHAAARMARHRRVVTHPKPVAIQVYEGRLLAPGSLWVVVVRAAIAVFVHTKGVTDLGGAWVYVWTQIVAVAANAINKKQIANATQA